MRNKYSHIKEKWSDIRIFYSDIRELDESLVLGGKMDILEMIENLQYKYVLDYLEKKDLIDFAVELLKKEYDDDDICILAGLDYDEMEEVMKYFLRITNRFGVDFFTKKTDEELYKYGLIILQKYLDGRINADKTLQIIEKINGETGYKTLLSTFEYLAEDKLSIEWKEDPIFNSELLDMKFDDFFSEYIKTFLKFKEEFENVNYKEIGFCNECNKMVEIKLYKNIFGNIQYRACSKCKSKNYIKVTSLTGMKKYLKTV